MVETYEEGRLLAFAKGYTFETLAREIASRPALKSFGLSATTLSRKSSTDEPLPREIAELIDGLEVQGNRHHQTDIVVMGLQVVHGVCPPEKDPRALAKALLEHFPTDGLAVKLADTLAQQAKVADGSGSLLDVVASAIVGRMPHATPLNEAKLARRLTKLDLKRMAVLGASAAVVSCLVLLLGVGRSHAASFPPVILLTTLRGMPVGLDARRLLLDARVDMGNKGTDTEIPDYPFPGQKLAKDCKPAMGDEAMNGGCWVWIATVKPPCGEGLFRRGDKCYRAVAEDPNKPVGIPE